MSRVGLGTAAPLAGATAAAAAPTYRLDDQTGFLLRQANQRHAAIFAEGIGCDLTQTQWAAVSKLAETGPVSQNRLGRMTAMDAATIKGVIDRLRLRGLIESRADRNDGRRLLVGLTEAGRALVTATVPHALAVTEATLVPLTADERRMLAALLRKLA
ncbi:MarR family winged helix-turn-helix transcriptional regulator [Chelatococcus reniformis]|uniref:Transcriptional regulator n=1 Tax=Chelatococcus reniformis TaxID=1494448 RepID=A0A916UC87_9HYPH|nr:MarR family transcriptional regulator [Chelatococcus reniformis]GGC66528.1 transcriptional regulator [Chelatococcus reniformis]